MMLPVLSNKQDETEVRKALLDLAASLGVAGGSIGSPVGSVTAYAGATAPDSWAICDGTQIRTADYPVLFGIIGYTYGGSGDLFTLPDMREAVPVGVGTRSSGVTAHDVYTLGQFKDDQAQGHEHNIQEGPSGGSLTGVAGANRTTTSGIILDGMSTAIKSNGTDGTPRTGTTTHGKQFGLNFIIKVS